MLMYNVGATGIKNNGALGEWLTREIRSNGRNFCPSVSSFITNHTWADRGLRHDRQLTNRLRDNAADFLNYFFLFKQAFSCPAFTDWKADPSGRTTLRVGLRPLDCWCRGYETRRGAWGFICCECCVLSDRGLWDWLISSPGEFYLLSYLTVI